MTRTKEQIKRRNEVGCINLGERADNLGVALATYFEGSWDCPEFEDDDGGWHPWALEKANMALDLIVDEIDSEKERFQEQIHYSAQLQRFVESLIRGNPVPDDVLRDCPNHARLLEERDSDA